MPADLQLAFVLLFFVALQWARETHERSRAEMQRFGSYRVTTRQSETNVRH